MRLHYLRIITTCRSSQRQILTKGGFSLRFVVLLSGVLFLLFYLSIGISGSRPDSWSTSGNCVRFVTGVFTNRWPRHHNGKHWNQKPSYKRSHSGATHILRTMNLPPGTFRTLINAFNHFPDISRRTPSTFRTQG